MRALQERGAGGRQRHAAARPLEKLNTESVLELPDLGAEDLLGDMNPARGRGEALILGHGHEITKMPQLNVHPALMVPTSTAERAS